ncbi:methyltransferase RsmF C-terminal domain-like protein [Bacteroides sp.]
MNLSASFTDATRALLGDEDYEKLYVALQQEPPVSIRLNRQKLKPALSFPLSTFNFQLPVPWTSEGFYLDERLTFTFDPLFHAGCYYVQEASSMFVEQVLRQFVEKPVRMLDLCAAPGGKSTHARSLLPEGSLLVANEVIRNRSQILAENLTKWGHPDVVVTNNDPADFARLGSFFDVILTDVPCSGEGMFRKDAGAIDEWSVDNVEICWQRQRRIIADIWPCLQPGGLLIYSTCTYNTKEDEENIDWMIREWGAEPLTVKVQPDWNITSNLLAGKDFPVYRFLPHRIKGEGFFLAALRKPFDAEYEEPEPVRLSSKKTAGGKGKNQPQPIGKELMKEAADWLNDAENYTLSTEGSSIVAYPKDFMNEFALLNQCLRVVQAGLPLAEVKGKDLIPAHGLAMSRLLNRSAFSTAELTYEQAIAYLRKEAVTLSAEAPRGYVLVTYREVPLGFVKNIGNRANNLYPQEWRIRSGYMPEEVRLL